MSFKLYKLLLICFLFFSSYHPAFSFEEKRSVIPPFENFSPNKSRTEYEFVLTDTDNPSLLVKKTFKIDQYSESSRSLLENALVNLGIKVIERMRVDRLLSESELTRKQGFANEQTALEIGKQIGADTLIMGTILGFQFKNEKVRAYGLNQDLLLTIANVRIRVIDIESGNVYFSRIYKGKHSITSSADVTNEVSDRIFSSLEDAINKIVSDEAFLEKTSNN